jgi:hypothetical protein
MSNGEILRKLQVTASTEKPRDLEALNLSLWEFYKRNLEGGVIYCGSQRNKGLEMGV